MQTQAYGDIYHMSHTVFQQSSQESEGIKRKSPGKKALQAAAADYTSEERTFVDA
jgi:hypothetical protein